LGLVSMAGIISTMGLMHGLSCVMVQEAPMEEITQQCKCLQENDYLACRWVHLRRWSDQGYHCRCIKVQGFCRQCDGSHVRIC
jgi:hypothetical protein